MDTTRLPCLKANKGLLNSAVGPLQRQLRSGEYNLFKFATMFESDFVQVSKRGGTSDVHNHVQLVRVAVAATSPSLQVPNVLLLARPVSPSEEQTPSLRNMFCRSPGKVTFELTRLLPLCFVKISVHDWEKQQLRFKMATGRTFYLQLFPQEGQADDFESWVKIIQLLRPPADLHLERKKREADLLKKGEPVLLSADATPTESSEPQSSEDGPCSTIAEILSILQEEPHNDEPNPAEPPESLPCAPEKVSFALLASKEEELNPMRSFGLLPSGEDESKPESPPPSEGPQEEPRRPPNRPRKKAKSKGRSASR
ncbi:hypothetical protein lerEdw1_010900 [Lerista edwardsae]|nr:hypothetical protein lerEdw1_010900 [Lerista edwardsae]